MALQSQFSSVKGAMDQGKHLALASFFCSAFVSLLFAYLGFLAFWLCQPFLASLVFCSSM